ncbi:hypothetical protein CVT24_005114 [Panaeolus cyanescens]|uniref:F-box domain-containing protein n=1 Tax=Panaeolus cyanescens TaxID=181874 RepID=A0A409W2B3_9AGAR|nr:hypothetical protein CVT24_005114 [Panaeolus cyanescens]
MPPRNFCRLHHRGWRPGWGSRIQDLSSPRNNGNTVKKFNIYGLPDELILEVFKFVTLSPPLDERTSTVQSVLRLSGVSKRFRRIIQSCSTIWANNIDFDTAHRACVEYFLEMNRANRPIHAVLLDRRTCDLHRYKESPAFWHWGVFLNRPEFPRCREIELSVTTCAWQDTHKDLLLRGIEDVCVLTIGFVKHGDTSGCSNEKPAPNASLFAEGNTYESWQSLSIDRRSFALCQAAFPGLKSLSITLQPEASRQKNAIMSSAQWLHFLHSLPLLETLHLEHAVRSNSQIQPCTRSISPVTLSHLLSLKLVGCQSDLGGLLAELHVGSSCAVEISTTVRRRDITTTGEGDSIRGLISFLQHHFLETPFGPSLQLYIGKCGIYRVPAGLYIQNFIKLDNVYQAHRPPRPKFQGGDEGIPRFSLTINFKFESSTRLTFIPLAPTKVLFTSAYTGTSSHLCLTPPSDALTTSFCPSSMMSFRKVQLRRHYLRHSRRSRALICLNWINAGHTSY